MKKKKRGGAQPGAGRPWQEPSTTMRIPVELKTDISEMIYNHKKNGMTQAKGKNQLKVAPFQPEPQNLK